MSNITMWDAGVDKGEDRYTILIGGRAVVVGFNEEGFVDDKNIQHLSADEIDKGYMDGCYKKIDIKELPKEIIDAVQVALKRLES